MRTSHQRKQLSFFCFCLHSFFLMSILSVTLLVPTVNGQKGIDAIKGQTLYTQFSLFYEENHHQTTNYRKGVLLPVNTEVKFVKSNNKSITVTLPYGEDLIFLNVEGFSGEKIEGIFKRTFATSPVDLSPFTKEEKDAILAGEVRLGMSRQATIMALGYPPKHKTPSLQLNQWQYWQNRFGTFIVYFENDKVKQVVD